MALGARMVAKVPPLEGEKEGTCFEKSSYVGLHSIYVVHTWSTMNYIHAVQTESSRSGHGIAMHIKACIKVRTFR